MVSPARGEWSLPNEELCLRLGFHSIGFPCERGERTECVISQEYILFPFNWFPLREGSADGHFYGFRPGRVSIQLVSPARGELGFLGYAVALKLKKVSIQLVSPACGELMATYLMKNTLKSSFPFNWFPLREGSTITGGIVRLRISKRVSIQLVSPARGEWATTIVHRLSNRGFHSIGFPCERGALRGKCIPDSR